MSTPLMIASKNGRVEVVNRLLEYGASADSQNKVHIIQCVFYTTFFNCMHCEIKSGTLGKGFSGCLETPLLLACGWELHCFFKLHNAIHSFMHVRETNWIGSTAHTLWH